jgi:hypothetical protein
MRWTMNGSRLSIASSGWVRWFQRNLEIVISSGVKSTREKPFSSIAGTIPEPRRSLRAPP